MIRIPVAATGEPGKRLEAARAGDKKHSEETATLTDYLEAASIGLACSAQGFDHIAAVMRAAMLDGAPVASLLAVAEWMAAELADGIRNAQDDAESAVSWANEFMDGEAP